MGFRFLGFLQRSAREGDAISIESRLGADSPAAPSLASNWADRGEAKGAPEPLSNSTAPPRSLPRDIGFGLRLSFELVKIVSATMLLTKLGMHALSWAPYATLPAVDRALRPSVYEPAQDIAHKARSAGFAGGAYVFGSPRFGEVKSDYEHHLNPAAKPSDGGNSSASLALQNQELPLVGSFNALPSACYIRMGGDDQAVLSDPKASRRFSALHELSHCDDMQGSWTRFSPSPATLDAEQARAFRLILLADSQLRKDDEEPLRSALTDAAHAANEAGPYDKAHWRGLSSNLFDESLADARALLMLSRLSPGSWRADGWEAWLQRAAGENGASGLIPHSHATEESIALILSTPDDQLRKLTPDGLSQLAAATASDGVVIKLAKQGWHQRLSPQMAPGALGLALQKISKIPPSHILWRQGALPNLAGSIDQLQQDRDWLASGRGAKALGSLLSRMGEIHDLAQKTVPIERHIENHAIPARIEPSAGSFDLRYEGSILRSPAASLIASAALYQRALKEGAPHGFKTPTDGIWPHMNRYLQVQAPLMRHMASREFLEEFAGKPIYFGHNPQRGPRAYLVGHSISEVAAAQSPASAALEPDEPAARARPKP